ncbi:hypothetical protein NUU61_006759 [Penicillium alfredii]|uniref:NACHT domain-containing protein n=1 Tax=Penicillium alfredii TaxID=1506179 RepID=A0A9W9K3N1_9EURO|nr:uncharacterized protein NUU61_006759 [Penicillium alfredii]KAJ5091889.1 hypothetical protein NUU61_006759 [Penicillium alfredii]
MADPLSISSGIAGLLSLGFGVTKSLVEFYSAYKDQDADVAHTCDKLDFLLGLFETLRSTLDDYQFLPNQQGILQRIETLIQKCEKLISNLQQECQKLDKSSAHNFKGKIKTFGHRLGYFFSKDTLLKLDREIGEIRDHLAVALDVIQLEDSKKAQKGISELRSLHISAMIRDWLDAPDASVNYNAACAKHHTGTGLWLVNGSRFKNWLTQSNSFLWLNGFSGCGKSVLCSTAIQYAFREKQRFFNKRGSFPHVGVAFFYFTFSDEAKKSQHAMLRAWLLQLSGQHGDCETDLKDLHDLYRNSTPPVDELISCLRRMIERFDQVYLLADGLDECPRSSSEEGVRYGPQEEVLETLNTIREWGLSSLHLLVTSRDESEIRAALDPSGEEDVVMKNAEIDRDIKNYVSAELNNDKKLQRWFKYHDDIKQALAERARGVFRYVECQFKEIRRCARNKESLLQCLNSLPPDLDRTYERMLCSIEDSCIDDARRILTLLCFSARPLTVDELVHGHAVNLEKLSFEREDRLLDPDSPFEICPGLIDIVPVDDSTTTLRIAHFSVQEYLQSDQIRGQKASMYSLQPEPSHNELAQTCLVYLLDPELSSNDLDDEVIEEFPLAPYAAMFWYHHYLKSGAAATETEDLVVKLFRDQQESFRTWIRLHDLDRSWEKRVQFKRAPDTIASPVYYASLLGLTKTLSEIIGIGADNGVLTHLINTLGGEYNTPLQAAALQGDEKIVQMLLDQGADVNAAEGGYWGSALRAASAGGHEKVVQMLLDQGADVHARQDAMKPGDALYQAAIAGHASIVQKLLAHGANIEPQDEYAGNSLIAASGGNHQQWWRDLLEQGRDLRAENGRHGNPYPAVPNSAHEEVVRILLERGADVNARDEIDYGNALEAAAAEGYEKIAQMLLAHGANAQAKASYFGRGLEAASVKGNAKIVQLLLEHGADVNAPGDEWANALHPAITLRHPEVEKLLREWGADFWANVEK